MVKQPKKTLEASLFHQDVCCRQTSHKTLVVIITQMPTGGSQRGKCLEEVAAILPELLHVGCVLSDGSSFQFLHPEEVPFLMSRNGRYTLGATLDWGNLPAITQLQLPCQKSGPVWPKLQLLLRRANFFLHEILLAFNFWQLAQITLISCKPIVTAL